MQNQVQMFLLNLGFDNPDLLDKIIIFYGKL